MSKQLLAAGAVLLAGSIAMASPMTYTDTHGDGGGSSNAARDIWSASVDNDATNLTFVIQLNPSANVSTTANTFDYAIGITSGPTATGDTSANATTHGNPYHEDISIDSSLGGMTNWVGIFPVANGAATTAGYNTYVWNATTSLWSTTSNVNTAALATAAGNSFGSQSGTTTNNLITIVMPLSAFPNLTLTPGSAFNFDVYSTGSSGSNTAYDSLADPSITQSGTFSNTVQFNNTTATGGLLTYTVQTPEPASLALMGLGGLAMLRRTRRAE